MISRFALAASLAFTVAACGSQSQPTDQPSAAETTPSAVATAAPEAAPTAAASATPAEAATPTPTPTPSAKPSAKASPDVAATGASAAMSAVPQAFNQCAACHSTTPGKTIIGPSLAHVYGRNAGSLAGFQYSDAMKGSGLTWTSSNLDAFLTNPAGKVPGTLMGLAGIKDAAQRKAIIAYLKTL
ncbi:MAG TPA: c-type cytochrome [Croceibacterium sp.]|nr:c-type cytochrome [Croceibacterium sp.]